MLLLPLDLVVDVYHELVMCPWHFRLLEPPHRLLVDCPLCDLVVVLLLVVNSPLPFPTRYICVVLKMSNPILVVGLSRFLQV